MSEVDAELSAMTVAAEAIGRLQPDAQVRVISWLVERFGAAVTRRDAPFNQRLSPETTSGDFADLFGAAQPKTEGDRALLAAYWVQEKIGLNPFDSQRVNSELKQLGYPVSNITRALTELADGTPRLVLQVRKSGTTAQSRKSYRLTAEGIRRVRELIAPSDSGGLSQRDRRNG